MTVTQALAVWGAFLSPLLAGWGIYKDWMKRDRVKVSAGFRVILDDTGTIDVFAVTVTNVTDKKLKITHVGVYSAPLARIKLFRARALRGGKKAFLLSFSHLYGSLPQVVEPHDATTILYTVTRENLPAVGCLYVITSDGRQWFAPMKDAREINAARSNLKSV
jgi:hypothetical protein